MIKVTQENEKTFTIEWDENDPGESIFNSFTEQDFIDVLQYYCEKELSKLEYTESLRKESGEVNDNIEELTEHFFQDYDQAYEEYIQASYEVSHNDEEWRSYHQDNTEAP